MLAANFALVFAMAVLAAAPFASAQSNSTGTGAPSAPDPDITITTGFARFSYGVVSLTVAVENPVQGVNEVNVKVFDPYGGIVSDKDETMHFNTFDNKSYFQSYHFSVERKYVYDSYKVVATYANQSETHSVPPFSTEFPQPPDISIERIQMHESGSIGIGGRVWGGIGNEQLDLAIYSPSDELVTTLAARLGLHAQFDAGVSADDARTLFAQSGEYRIVADLVGTDAPQVERTFEYRNNQSDPSPPQDKVDLDVVTTDSAGNQIEGIQVTLLQDGTVTASQASPASFSVDNQTEYTVSVDDSDDYQFDRWQDTGSKSTQRSIVAASATTMLTAVYSVVDTEPDSDGDEQEEDTDPEPEGDGMVPAARSPFKFLPKTQTLTAVEEEPETTAEEVLMINGKIGSYAIGLPVNQGNNSQEYLHIISGSWSLAIDSDNNLAGLKANFTSVRADGADRHVHMLAANATSAIKFDGQLAAMTISNLPLIIQTDSGIKSMNATVAILHLNAIKIDLDEGAGQLLWQPIYGVTTALEYNGIEAPIGAGHAGVA